MLPVIYAESSLTKKEIVLAISSGVPTLLAAPHFLFVLSSFRILLNRSINITRAKILTRFPSSPTCCTRRLAHTAKAAFDAE